jgi:nitrite reductase (NADH) small subunit
MSEVFVVKVAEFAEGDRRIVTHDGVEIGVFHWQGNFYAYENLCLHQGGPCCEGTRGAGTAAVDAGGRVSQHPIG